MVYPVEMIVYETAEIENKLNIGQKMLKIEYKWLKYCCWMCKDAYKRPIFWDNFTIWATKYSMNTFFDRWWNLELEFSSYYFVKQSKGIEFL